MLVVSKPEDAILLLFTCLAHKSWTETTREDAGQHSPSFWLQGSWFRAKDAAWTLPWESTCRSAWAGCSIGLQRDRDRIHNSFPPILKQFQSKKSLKKKFLMPEDFRNLQKLDTQSKGVGIEYKYLLLKYLYTIHDLYLHLKHLYTTHELSKGSQALLKWGLNITGEKKKYAHTHSVWFLISLHKNKSQCHNKRPSAGAATCRRHLQKANL